MPIRTDAHLIHVTRSYDTLLYADWMREMNIEESSESESHYRVVEVWGRQDLRILARKQPRFGTRLPC